MDTNARKELEFLIDEMIKKTSREEVMNALNQLLNMSEEDMNEIAEYCRMIEERETTSH